MIAFSFIHAADLHMDTPFKGLSHLPEQIRQDIMDSTFDAFDRLIQLALDEKVDFVVISGDIYDAADSSLRAQFKLQHGLQLLSDAHISSFVIHGNHDPLQPKNIEWKRPERVHVFAADEVQCRTACNREGQVVANIYGISFGKSAVTDNLALQFQAQPADTYHIGMLHCNVDGQPEHDRYAPCSIKDLLEAGMDYWALGHIHSRQVLHEQPMIVYPGNVQGRHIHEQGEKGCFIVSVSERGESTTEFRALDGVRWVETAIDISPYPTLDELKDEIIEQLTVDVDEDSERSMIYRVVLYGAGALNAVLEKEDHLAELLHILREECNGSGGVWIWIKDLKVKLDKTWDKEELRSQESFIGDMFRLAEQATDHEEVWNRISGRAFESLLSHPKAGKFVKQGLLSHRQEIIELAEEKAVQMLLQEQSDEY